MPRDRNLVPGDAGFFEQPAMRREAADTLDELAAKGRKIAGVIRQRDRMNIEQAEELGRVLLEGRAICPHGEWQKFLEKMTVSKSRAHDYMKIAKCPARSIFEDAGSIREAVAMIAQWEAENEVIDIGETESDETTYGDADQPSPGAESGLSGVNTTPSTPPPASPGNAKHVQEPEHVRGSKPGAGIGSSNAGGPSNDPSTSVAAPPPASILCNSCQRAQRVGQPLPKNCPVCKEVSKPPKPPPAGSGNEPSRWPATPKPAPPAFDWAGWKQPTETVENILTATAARFNAAEDAAYQAVLRLYQNARSRAEEWLAGVTKEPLPEANERPRDLLFDAIVKVTGSDPKLNGSHVGKCCAALRSADPPYTPEEVLALPGVLGKMGLTFTIATPAAVEKHIAKVRSFTGSKEHSGLREFVEAHANDVP